MKRIRLTQGKVAIVDDKYYPMLTTVGSWCLQSKRYAASRIRGRLWLMHDLIMLWAAGPAPAGKEVDHRNRNGLDNRRRNLRYATSTQNSVNRQKTSKNTSGYKGVYWHKRAGKWMAQLQFKHRYHYLGLFKSKIAAAKAYNQALLGLAGEFACTNKI